MKNILLIYADIRGGNQGEFSFGVSVLAAVLKSRGYSVSFFHVLRDISKDEFLSFPAFKNADLVGISYLSFSKDIVRKWPAWIKSIRNIPVVAGGIHPTLDPEDAISIDGMDMALIGESDLTLLTLLDAFNGKIDFSAVPSLWRKQNGKILKNNEKKVIQDMDELPFFDTDVFDFKNLLSSVTKLSYLPFSTSRGCPFNCSYCSNYYLRRLHPEGAQYVRRQSVSRTIRELKFLLNKHPYLKTVNFIDDLFNFDTNWLDEFAQEYPSQIGVPFRVLVRIDILTEYQASLLKKAGCFRATFGLESGDPGVRNEIMNRKMTDEAIMRGVSYLKKNNIQTVSYNMVGLPGETNQKMLQTIKLNVKCGNDIAFCSIFQPHANTPMYKTCKEKGYLTNRRYGSVYEGSTLRLPFISETDIKFAHRTFRLFIVIYKIISKLPQPLRTLFSKITDSLFFSPEQFKRLLIKIHDKWFKEKILTQQYRRLERELVEGQK